jgi:hypothetical protein
LQRAEIRHTRPSSEEIVLSVFTSDVFLDAFSPVINATPVYGKGLWISHGRFISKAEGSAWNLFVRNPNVDEMIDVAKEHGCWFLRFIAAESVENERLNAPIPSPTLLTLPNFSPNKDLRWSLRKAEKAGFTIESCRASDIQSILDQLWTRLRRGIPQTFYETLEKAGFGKSLVARTADQAASGLFYLIDEENVWYMYSLATDPAFKSSQVTSFLVYSFIREAFESGAPYVDLCGSSIPSIADFKRQFASKEHSRPLYIVSLNPLYPLARKAVSTLRAFTGAT